MRVLGIDPSLTGTAVAVLGTDMPTPHTAQLPTKGRHADSVPVIDERIGRIADFVLDHAALVALAVIEGPSHGSRGGSPWDRAGLWWRIVHRLLALDVPVAVCPPAVRAKWATGVGSGPKATKPLVSVAVSRLWPGVEAGSDDEYDALGLATLGAQHLGLDVPTRAHHATARASVAWPDITARGAA